MIIYFTFFLKTNQNHSEPALVKNDFGQEHYKFCPILIQSLSILKMIVSGKPC